MNIFNTKHKLTIQKNFFFLPQTYVTWKFDDDVWSLKVFVWVEFLSWLLFGIANVLFVWSDELRSGASTGLGAAGEVTKGDELVFERDTGRISSGL